MCWARAKELGESKKLTADNDIIVYKIVVNFNESIRSYFTFFKYVPHIIYELNQDLSLVTRKAWDDYNIFDGFHSYNGECKVSFFRYSPDTLYVYIDKLIRCKYCQKEVQGIITVAEFAIPTGSTYYENECGEIVSDKIMLTGRAIQMSTIRDMILDESKTNASISFTQLFNKLDK